MSDNPCEICEDGSMCADTVRQQEPGCPFKGNRSIMTMQEEIDRLKDQNTELVEALGDLAFECAGVWDTLPPSRTTYNAAFNIIKKSEGLGMSEHKARWKISLDCECPKCDADFDLIDEDDFWGGGIEPIENGTVSTTDYEAVCPECGHEFLVDFEY